MSRNNEKDVEEEIDDESLHRNNHQNGGLDLFVGIISQNDYDGANNNNKPRQQLQQTALLFAETTSNMQDNNDNNMKATTTTTTASPKTTISTRLRWTTNALALLSVFLFSGIIYGWAPLQLLLMREHQYEQQQQQDCHNDASCKDPQQQQQMDHFHVIFTAAQFFLSFASLPVGIFLDVCTSQPLYYGVTAVFQVTGLLLFGISDTISHGHDFFVVAYSFIAIGGCMTMLGAFPTSFLLPHHQAGILAAISCLFDASSIVFAVFDCLNTTIKNNLLYFSRLHLFVAHACIGVVVYSLLAYCWAMVEQVSDNDDDDDDWQALLEREQQQQQQQLEDERRHPHLDDTTTATTNGLSTNDREGQQQPKEEKSTTSSTTTTLTTDLYLQRIRRLGMHEWSLQRQLCTFEFVLALTFASVHMLRCNFYIETVNEFLSLMAAATTAADDADDDAAAAYYANIFSFVLPSGIVFVPVIEATVRRLGVVQTLHFTNAIGVLFGILLLIPSVHVQVLNFVVFTCFRAYLYASLNTFIALTFGVGTMGRVIGSTFTTAAVVTLLQYPAATMVATRYHGDFTIVNTIMVSTCALPIVLALICSSRVHRRQRTTTTPGQDGEEEETQPLVENRT